MRIFSIFFTSILLFTLISCDDSTSSPQKGAEGGPCYEDKSCFHGLICSDSNICIKDTSSPDKDINSDEDTETDTDILVDEDATPDEDEIIDEDTETDTDILVDEDATPDEDEIIDEDTETDTDIPVDEDAAPDEDETIDEDTETDIDIPVDEDIVVLSDDATLSSLSASGITLSPAFNPTVYDYSGSTENFSTDIIVIPSNTYASVTINGDPVISGQPYTLPVISDYVQAEIIVTAQNGFDKRYYYLTISKLSDNAYLSNLYINSYIIQELAPVFNKNTLNYTLATNIDTLEIRPISEDSGSTVQINGIISQSGTIKTLTLANGSNTITITVTAENGINTKEYKILATRLKTDSKLSSMTFSSGTLNPSFSSSTYNYNLAISGVSSLTIIPTASDSNAEIKVDGTIVSSGTQRNITISSMNQTIVVKVTAEDGVSSTTYYIYTDSSSNNAYLSSLSVTGETLSPLFNKNTSNYTVTTHKSSIEISATSEDSNALVQSSVLGNSQGTVTGTKAMNPGENTLLIPITVTAADNTTEKTYAVTYNYTNAAPSASDQKISGKPYLGVNFSADYTFSDSDGDNEGNTTYQWYRCITTTNCSAINGETSNSHKTTEEDTGKYLKVDITPKDSAFNSLAGTTVSAITSDTIRPFYSYSESEGDAFNVTSNVNGSDFILSAITSEGILHAQTDLSDFNDEPKTVEELFTLPLSVPIANVLYTADKSIFAYSDATSTKATSWTVGNLTTTALSDPSASSSDVIWLIGGGTDSTYIIMKQGNDFIIRTWNGTIWSDYTSENVAATDGDFGSLNNKPFAVYTDGTNTSAVTFEPVMTPFASQPSNDLLSNISITVIGSDIYAAGLNSSGNIKVLKYSSGLWSSVFLSTTAASDVKIAVSSNKLFLIYIASDETLQYMEYNLTSWTAPVKAGNTSAGEDIDIEANNSGKVVISYFSYDINGTHIIVR